MNNYPNTDLVDNLECRYIAYSKEVGESGTPHLQGYVSYVNAKTKSAVIKMMPGCHIEVMKGSYAQNEAYCSKSGKLVERGDRPVENLDKGRANQLRWKRTWDLACSGKFEDIDADLRIRHYNTFKKIAMDYMVRPVPLSETTGLWIYGKSGIGKTKFVFDTYPGHYVKSRNKWWNGYSNEEVVVCDDIGIEDAKWMGSFLKDWAGQYPFQAESKGSGLMIRPKKFIVTSQYPIENLWLDQETRDALLRRFEVKYMS